MRFPFAPIELIGELCWGETTRCACAVGRASTAGGSGEIISKSPRRRPIGPETCKNLGNLIIVNRVRSLTSVPENQFNFLDQLFRTKRFFQRPLKAWPRSYDLDRLALKWQSSR